MNYQQVLPKGRLPRLDIHSLRWMSQWDGCLQLPALTTGCSAILYRRTSHVPRFHVTVPTRKLVNSFGFSVMALLGSAVIEGLSWVYVLPWGQCLTGVRKRNVVA